MNAERRTEDDSSDLGGLPEWAQEMHAGAERVTDMFGAGLMADEVLVLCDGFALVLKAARMAQSLFRTIDYAAPEVLASADFRDQAFGIAREIDKALQRVEEMGNGT